LAHPRRKLVFLIIGDKTFPKYKLHIGELDKLNLFGRMVFERESKTVRAVVLSVSITSPMSMVI
jgi:hypothetical protein